MSIFANMFNSQPAATPAANTTPAGVAPTPATPATPANTDAFTPNHTTDPKQTATTTAPLAEFSELFKVDPKAEAQTDEAFAWNYDREKLEATVGGMSFVDPTQAQELATALGVQNPEMLANFMNGFGRNLYMQSLLVNSKMSEQSVGIAEQRFAKAVPTHIRNNLVNNEVTAADGNFSNPALAPMVSMISAQIAQKNPQFTPEQVAEHTKQYMAGVAQVFSPKPVASTAAKLNQPADFSDFFGGQHP